MLRQRVSVVSLPVAKSLVKDVPRIVDLLADILQNSKLTDAQVFYAFELSIMSLL